MPMCSSTSLLTAREDELWCPEPLLSAALPAASRFGPFPLAPLTWHRVQQGVE